MAVTWYTQKIHTEQDTCFLAESPVESFTFQADLSEESCAQVFRMADDVCRLGNRALAILKPRVDDLKEIVMYDYLIEMVKENQAAAEASAANTPDHFIAWNRKKEASEQVFLYFQMNGISPEALIDLGYSLGREYGNPREAFIRSRCLTLWPRIARAYWMKRIPRRSILRTSPLPSWKRRISGMACKSVWRKNPCGSASPGSPHSV